LYGLAGPVALTETFETASMRKTKSAFLFLSAVRFFPANVAPLTVIETVPLVPV
jgi:hypothetical protein